MLVNLLMSLLLALAPLSTKIRSHGYELTDLTNTTGTIPIKTSTDVFSNKSPTHLHTFNLTTLDNEINSLFLNAHSLTNSSIDSTLLQTPSQHFNYLFNKLEHIKSYQPQSRLRRGIFNGLGTAISWITGNMDAYDKEHYNSVIQNIENNEHLIQKNLATQVVYNHGLAEKFDENMKIVQNNNASVLDRLQQYFLLASVSLLELHVNDIAGSLEFCKKNILHSSIMSRTKVSSIVPNTPDNVASWDASVLWQILNVHCALSNELLTYFVQIPIQTLLLDSYFILSYPITPNTNLKDYREYTLKINTFVVSYYKNKLFFIDDCASVSNVRYCSKIETVTDQCILDLFSNNDMQNCELISLNATYGFIKYINVISSYLVYKKSNVRICFNDSEQSINMYSTSLIHVSINEKICDFHNPPTYKDALPLVVSKLPPRFKTVNVKFEKVHLANLENTNLDEMESITSVDNSHRIHIIFLGITLSVTIVIVLILFFFLRDKRNRNVVVQEHVQLNNLPTRLVIPVTSL